MTDLELIDAFNKGGRSLEVATQYFIEKNVYQVDKMSKKIGLHIDTILDAYTDAIVDLTHQIRTDRFKAKSKVSTYFYRIFYNKCIDLSRKNTTKYTGQYSEHEIPSEQNIALDLNNKDMVDSLKVYFKKLGDPCHQILIDWGYWGYSMVEIADRNGLDSAAQAKDKKYRCLKLLKSIIPFNYE